ncbi:hypothetical protein [Clostridium sp. Marseille-Q2269]|uniref:hypothetical protein n=1 Tax=Clostridium sp. Marseille-Q2269 TaxID=2942205 RepID=UPI002073B3E3|nr:hypothetical protein [Clostridium sp. Marseille-Q2269]
METIKRITGMGIVHRAEGKRIAFTYMEIDPEGNIENDNEKQSFIVLDSEVEKAIDTIEDFIMENKLK